MEKTFRAILLEHLETENESSHHAAPSPSRPTTDDFNFTAVEFRRPHGQTKSVPSGYRAFTSAKSAVSPSETGKMRPRAGSATRPEPLIDMNKFSTAERLLLDRLIDLGANELKDGVSAKRLKKAHRRLAKIWHPDACHAADAASRFMEIQTAYKDLEAALRRSISESAGGNESASAAESQRRAAA